MIFILLGSFLQAQEGIQFKGQLSSWLHYNAENNLSFLFGARYIPQLNYAYSFKNDQRLDFETSINSFATISSNVSDSIVFDGSIKPYRAWIRYSGKQFELRAGLQKINFGSATMLRPLMWFDEVDARDPLKLTDGVWGLLGRYYFLNNANIWMWVLYGNENPRGWEFVERNKRYPEFGGRIQFPLSKSEMGFSYHHQIIDMQSIAIITAPLESISENKIGFDIKIDWHIGFWIEGVWSTRNADIGILKNQEMITIGADYTFGIGNGLYLIAEHFLSSFDENAFEFQQPINFTATSISYPVGLFDNINAIFYYDWGNNSAYSFLNWQKQFNNWSVNLMAYWNPENSALPTSGAVNLYGGKGMQLMLIFNH